jgi:hypothetical protein
VDNLWKGLFQTAVGIPLAVFLEHDSASAVVLWSERRGQLKTGERFLYPRPLSKCTSPLTSLQQLQVKTGCRRVKHACLCCLLLPESSPPRRFFASHVAADRVAVIPYGVAKTWVPSSSFKKTQGEDV